MLPLSSLLDLEYDLSLGGQPADLVVDTPKNQIETTDTPETSEALASKEANTHGPQTKQKRNVLAKRQRQRLTPTTSHLPPPLPAPLRFRRIQNSNPPRYRDIVGIDHRAPFWERQQQEEAQQKSPKKKSVVSIRRHSQLCAFLITLVSFVAVDDYAFLPTGTVLYALTLCIAWENWENETQENLRYQEKLKLYHQQMEQIEKDIQRAEFEYHVLRNLPHVDIKALRATNNPGELDPENDRWIVYADHGQRRPQQRVRQQQNRKKTQLQHLPNGSPRYWRTIPDTKP